LNPKYRKHRDESYLEEQREKECLGCGSPPRGDPHHCFNSGGKHGNDLMAVPLCRKCHSELHTSKCTEEEWWELKGYDIWYVIVNNLIDKLETQ